VAEGERTGGLALLRSPGTFGNQPEILSNSKSVNSIITAGAASQIPKRHLIYVRYKDHVIFKNVSQEPVEAVERETVGWLTNETEDLLLIQHDRPVTKDEKRVNGIIILRNCIIRAYQISLRNSELPSNSGAPSRKLNEYAFRSAERKTHRVKNSGEGKKK